MSDNEESDVSIDHQISNQTTIERIETEIQHNSVCKILINPLPEKIVKKRKPRTMTPEAIDSITNARAIAVQKRKQYALERREWNSKQKELEQLQKKEYEYSTLVDTVQDLKDKFEKPADIIETFIEKIVEKPVYIKTTSFGQKNLSSNGFIFKKR